MAINNDGYAKKKKKKIDNTNTPPDCLDIT